MASGPRRGEITVLLVVWAVLGPKVGELCLSRRGFAALCRGCQWGAGGVWAGLGGRAAHPLHYHFYIQKIINIFGKTCKKCKKLQIYTKYRRGGSKQSSDLKKYEEYIVGNHPHEAMLGTTLIRPGLQSKLSSLTVCNSKNGMGFGPSWALMRPCWETILESSWGSLGPSWDYLVAFLGLS